MEDDSFNQTGRHPSNPKNTCQSRIRRLHSSASSGGIPPPRSRISTKRSACSISSGVSSAHYHTERPHQGLDGTLIQPANDHAADGPLVRRERLGGLLNYYCREAA